MASGWAGPAPSWAGSWKTTRPPTTSSARSAACTTRPIGSTKRRSYDPLPRDDAGGEGRHEPDLVTAPPPGVVRNPSALAPLANPAFRGLWIANLLSNIGGWMATTGAAWEMTTLTTEPVFLALLAAPGTPPMFLFCFLPGGLPAPFCPRPC